MTAAKRIWRIWESGPLVRIDSHDLPDLDDVLLEVAAWSLDEDFHDEDEPTSIYGGRGEASVGWYRTNPCACGEGHGFDIDTVAVDEEGRPIGRAARGAFLAVYFDGW